MTKFATDTGDAGLDKEARLARAFAKLTTEIRAVPPEQYAVVNVDVYEAVATVLGAIPRLRELRPAIVAITSLDIEPYDKLEERALALAHAQGAYLVAMAPRVLEETGEEATAAREFLLTDARALAKRKLVDSERLTSIKGGPGYQQTASDLIALVGVFRHHWSKLEGKTPITLEELENAEVLADDLLVGVGERRRVREPKGAYADRQGAFTLFIRSYKEARRMIEFLRYHESDVEEILPSIHASKGRRKAQATTGEDEASDDNDEPPSITTPSPAPSATSNVSASAAASSAAAPAAGTATPQADAQRTARAQRAMLEGEALPIHSSGMEGLPGVAPFKD